MKRVELKKLLDKGETITEDEFARAKALNEEIKPLDLELKSAVESENLQAENAAELKRYSTPAGGSEGCFPRAKGSIWD